MGLGSLLHPMHFAVFTAAGYMFLGKNEVLFLARWLGKGAGRTVRFISYARVESAAIMTKVRGLAQTERVDVADFGRDVRESVHQLDRARHEMMSASIQSSPTQFLRTAVETVVNTAPPAGDAKAAAAAETVAEAAERIAPHVMQTSSFSSSTTSSVVSSVEGGARSGCDILVEIHREVLDAKLNPAGKR